MANQDKPSARRPASAGRLAVRNVDALVFAADMYGLQMDQLAALAGGERAARAAASRWRELGYAETARLSAGAPWLWVTRAGLAACGLGYRQARPRSPSSRTPGRSPPPGSRSRRPTPTGPPARTGGASGGSGHGSGAGVGVRQHLPDAEVHWPDGARGQDGTPIGWAGECWAIEAELTPKTVARTTAIMREILFRTGDYGCPAADVSVPGRPPRHARALYLCSPAALADGAAGPGRPRPAGRPRRGARPAARRAPLVDAAPGRTGAAAAVRDRRRAWPDRASPPCRRGPSEPHARRSSPYGKSM